MFAKFGELQSVFVQKVNSTKPEVPNRLLAFVCFKDPDGAIIELIEFITGPN